MKLLLLLAFFFIVMNPPANSQAQIDLLAAKFPVDSGYFSSFDGTKIYYDVRGDGKPVLLVHGFIVNSTRGRELHSTAIF